MTHTEGDTFVLVCSFSAIPDPLIHWEKDGELFLLGEGRRITNSTIINGQGQSQLEINSLVLNDTGVYTCMVSNLAGMAVRSVRLVVGGEGQLEIENLSFDPPLPFPLMCSFHSTLLARPFLPPVLILAVCKWQGKAWEIYHMGDLNVHYLTVLM